MGVTLMNWDGDYIGGVFLNGGYVGELAIRGLTVV